MKGLIGAWPSSVKPRYSGRNGRDLDTKEGCNLLDSRSMVLFHESELVESHHSTASAKP
jgi:hypothetical protein